VTRHNGGFSEEQLAEFADYFQKQGKFIEISLNHRNVDNNTAEISGTVKFEKSAQDVEANLSKDGQEWKVTKLQMKPGKE